MAYNSGTKVWVVFEGRKPGIYSSWPLADIQVNGFKGQLHKAYNCYEEGVAEWRSYCIAKGYGEEYIHGNIHVEFEAGTSSQSAGGASQHNPMRRMISQLAEDTSSDEFVIQHSMQRQLAAVCNILRMEEPKYRLHEKKTFDGVEYCRYYASLQTNSIGIPVVSLGRFGKNENDAKEDVAALLLRRLMVATGKKIRDLNHYNVQLLEEQLHKTMDENMELEMEIAILNEEISLMKVKGEK